jgi:xylan 1,4-beta-xylosidase
MDTIFFNAHHAPPGAFASFTLGQKGASGGLGLERGSPPRQNVFIGCETGQPGVFEALPFFKESESHREQFGLDADSGSGDGGVRILPFPDASVQRQFSICSDTISAGDLRCTILSRAPALPDPDVLPDADTLKKMLLPAVLVEIAIDNRSGTSDRTAFFGFSGNDPYSGMRRRVTDHWSVIGQGRHCAIYSSDEAVRTGIDFSAEAILQAAAGDRLQSGLGETALLLFTVPAGELKVFRCAVCFFRDGVVTSGIEGTYWYRRFYSSIDDAGAYALEHFDELAAAAQSDERAFDVSHLAPSRSFMLTHAVRSYYGSTELLATGDGPLWIVNEGEYRMINTLDLTVDQIFFELAVHPWALRNTLDWYADRYSFIDRMQSGEGAAVPGGRAFTHDMGVANVFAPNRTSAYETPGLQGCFSYMTHEELLNWVLCAGVYVLYTMDAAWLQKRTTLLMECLESIVRRDDPDPALRSGMFRRDTALAGDGSEITTYDSLDPSLGQARCNAYVTVKRWAALVLLHQLFEQAGAQSLSRTAYQEALRSANAITGAVTQNGIIPALLDGSSDAAALPVVEGLVYPWIAGCYERYAADANFTVFFGALQRHLTSVLESGVCRLPDGGWRLSSSSDITWLSKLYLCRFIATELLGIKENDEFSAADATHCKWLLDEANSLFAWSDQLRDGNVIGSRYYPRGVTAMLWLLEGKGKPSAGKSGL